MPVYNAKTEFLKQAINSVKNQYYSNWELCICDDHSANSDVLKILQDEKAKDSRIKLHLSEKNGGISVASNYALNLAEGEFLLLLDHDDILSRNALLEIVSTINKYPDVDFIYSDEDKLDQRGNHVEPFFKPDWSPDLLFSYNYPIHVSVFRTKIIKQIHGFRKEFDGSQDYDLILRYLEQVKIIKHISKILYSWRKSIGSTALHFTEKSYAYETGRKAITSALERRNIDAVCNEGIQSGTYHVKYKIKNTPLVSIIIPTRKFENIQTCINSIKEKSTYENYEIIVLDSSTEKSIKEYCNKNNNIKYEKIKSIKFNFSKINNDAIKYCNGEYVIFLNDDTKVITSNWIEALLEHAQRDEIGIVGLKLLYENDHVQHAGTIVGIQHHAGNYGGMYKTDGGYFSFANIIRNCSAVTAACMMMKKKFFSEIGGFDENLARAWQDVDLCIRVLETGKNIVYTPYTTMYHYEGKTRGSTDSTNEELEARKIFRTKHKNFIEKGDPFYNPNLSLWKPYEILSNQNKPMKTLIDLYSGRPDLQKTFPDEQKNKFKNLIDWAATHGIVSDSHREFLQPHSKYYFENCSNDAKVLATKIKNYLESNELQNKFPEVKNGNYTNYLNIKIN
jgi:glycosyltransferase involved in cell wall biosynthesis